jgi:HK97 family phage portal protein
MNFLPAPLRRLFSRGALSNPDTGYQAPALEMTDTKSGTRVTDEQALKISAVWSCVSLIANSVAGLPITVYRDTENGRQPVDRRHALTDLLHIRPNQYMKPRDFRMAMTVQMALWNNAYAEIGYNGDRPVSLIPLRPGRMLPFITDGGELQYHYHVDQGVKIYSSQSIFHLRGITTEGIVGAERNNYAREAMGLSVAAETFAAKQFANGGRPGGVITFDKFLNSDQREQAAKLYQNISEGAINANKLWVLEGGSKYDALDFAADKMQMISTRNKQDSDIARFFGVPGVLIGVGDTTNSAWPASFEQQMLAFLTFTLQSYLDEWEAEIKHSLVQQRDVGVDHDTAPLVKMDSTAKANYLSRLAQNGFITRNEGRVRLNLPKVDDPAADELTIQTNLAEIGNLEGHSNEGEETVGTGGMPAEIRQ